MSNQPRIQRRKRSQPASEKPKTQPEVVEGQLPIWPDSEEAEAQQDIEPTDKPSASEDEEEKPNTIFDTITDMASMVVSIRKGFGLRTEDAISIVSLTLNWALAREQMQQRNPWATPAPPVDPETPETPESEVTPDDEGSSE